VRLRGLKTLNYQFVTVEGCTTLLNNLHNMTDLLQYAKQLKVDMLGVHDDYLKDMYNENFFEQCQKYRKFKLLKRVKPCLSSTHRIKRDEPEPKLMVINKRSIKKMRSHKLMKPLSRKLLTRIISECRIVKKLNVHITVVECIVMFAESMPLPISYSILCLPCFSAIRTNETYTASLKN